MDNKKQEIDNILKNENIPNILFHGFYDYGKEDLCKYFLQTLYPKYDDFQKYVMEINCLHSNGIQQIKQTIKTFSMQTVNKTKFKTILLKHAEFLTHDAQYSLRRNIETYSQNTRFVILCENKNKLLLPIRSRFVHIFVNVCKSNKLLNDCESFPYKKYNEFMKTYMNLVEKKSPFKEYVVLANEMYNNHFSALDIINRFKKHEYYHEAQYLLEKYKKEYRNEILCILFLFQLFRNKSEIQIFHK